LSRAAKKHGITRAVFADGVYAGEFLRAFLRQAEIEIFRKRKGDRLSTTSQASKRVANCIARSTRSDGRYRVKVGKEIEAKWKTECIFSLCRSGAAIADRRIFNRGGPFGIP
jgi:hypothetical protein